MLLENAERRATGILHTSGGTTVSRYQFAVKLASLQPRCQINNMSGKSHTVYGWDESEHDLYVLFYNLYSDAGRGHP
jgi:hypothetical protein